MGIDIKGKQEVEVVFFLCVWFFVDEVEQFVIIGEVQYVVVQGLIVIGDIMLFGVVIVGLVLGWILLEEIMLFDGMGVGFQDFVVVLVVVDIVWV